MSEVTRNDLMYFQDEVLSDIKKLENRFGVKLEKAMEQIKNKFDTTEETFTEITNKITDFNHSLSQISSNNSQLNNILKFKTNTEDTLSIFESKINNLERDLGNTKYNFEKSVQSSLSLPGIIGEGGKYLNFRTFMEFIYKSVISLNSFKDVNVIDFKNYKEKLENLISQFKIKFEIVQNKCIEYCNNKFQDFENLLNEKIKYLEEKIDSMRIENNKISNKLIEHTKFLKVDIKSIESFKEAVEKNLKEEYEKYSELYNEAMKKFVRSEEDYKIFKMKFNELSSFIKDVRFGKNITHKDFREMSRKIDFSNKNKIENNNNSISISELNRSNDIFQNKEKKINNITPLINESPVSARLNKRNVELNRRNENDLEDNKLLQNPNMITENDINTFENNDNQQLNQNIENNNDEDNNDKDLKNNSFYKKINHNNIVSNIKIPNNNTLINFDNSKVKNVKYNQNISFNKLQNSRKKSKSEINIQESFFNFTTTNNNINSTKNNNNSQKPIFQLQNNYDMNHLLYKIKKGTYKNKSITLNTFSNGFDKIIQGKKKLKDINNDNTNSTNPITKTYYYSSMLNSDNIIDLYKKFDLSQKSINNLEEKMNKKFNELNDLINEFIDKKNPEKKSKLNNLVIDSETLFQNKNPNLDGFLYGYSLKKVSRSSSKNQFNSSRKVFDNSLTKSNSNHFMKTNQLLNNNTDFVLNNYDNKFVYVRTIKPYSLQK